ncbi:MAG: hypothetical protein ACT4OP_10290 [Actinomycetota bacterium]
MSANSDLEEEEALRIATDEVSTMRRRRRRANAWGSTMRVVLDANVLVSAATSQGARRRHHRHG